MIIQAAATTDTTKIALIPYIGSLKIVHLYKNSEIHVSSNSQT